MSTVFHATLKSCQLKNLPEKKFYLYTVWTNTLFSFTMTRPARFKFTAGQFARIGLQVGDQLVDRAYWVVSSPFDETLEFLDCRSQKVNLLPNLQHLEKSGMSCIWKKFLMVI